MNTIKQRKHLFVLLVLLALFAACKGESPTAPTSTSPGGGVTPPVGSAVVLTVSQAEPFTTSSSVITATVTTNGQPVANGTAVEFTTDFGTFTETGTQSALRTTTNGVATITLASPTAGKATIQAVVNNVSKTTSVTFKVKTQEPCTPGVNCPKLVPTITSIDPVVGNPGGGELVTIKGTNFTAPVKVFFDFGTGTTPKEVFVASATDTQIVVTSPAVDLGTGQTKNATIFVLTEAGTASEQRATAPAPFVYQAQVLTPTISTVSPDSGPIEGGTRITIFGSGFQAPVQVSFAPGTSGGAAGWTAMQVISISFSQIVAITPTARDVNPNGSGLLVGAVDLRVRNINSNTENIKAVAFLYKAKSQITAFGPGFGTAFGGTRVTIDGVGFNDPVTVSIAGVAATPISVNGTQVIAITGRTAIPCSPPTGAVVVTNVDNGDSASSGTVFAYTAEKPLITGFTLGSCGNNPGCSVTFTVLKPGVGLDGTGLIRFTFGTGVTASTVFPTPSLITEPFGPTSFVMTIPPVDFPTIACTTGGGLAGTKLGDTKVPVTFTNITTTCTDTINNFVISPPGPNACTATSPPPVATFTPSSFCAPNPDFGSHAVGTTTPMNITVSNTAPPGGQSLTVSSPTITGPNFSEFSESPATLTVAPGASALMTVTFAPTTAGTKDATLTVVTNDPTKQTVSICLHGTATP